MTTPQHKIIDREQAVLGLARLLGVQIEHKGWSAEEALRRALLGAFADDYDSPEAKAALGLMDALLALQCIRQLLTAELDTGTLLTLIDAATQTAVPGFKWDGQSWPTLHKAAAALGHPTEGPLAWAIWQVSARLSLTSKQTAEWMRACGYQPFAGYPLQRLDNGKDTEAEAKRIALLHGITLERSGHKQWRATCDDDYLCLNFDDPTQCLNAALAHKREADFEAQFQPMPEGKMSRACISEMYDCDDSDYMGDGCEWNTGVDLLLGPDGNTRSGAKVGTLNDVPNQPDSEDDEGDDAERGDTDPPLFLTQGGIYVWHCWHAECLSENWYTTDPEDADIDHGGNAQFDVRDLPVAPPVGDDGRADHRGRIIAAIDAGLITEDGYADPDDLAEEAK